MVDLPDAGGGEPPQTHRPRRSLWRVLGPGLITGASDDDPSGIATYSQAGAQFGYQLAWTMPFSYPLLSAIQEITARIGRVTGQGLAGNMRQHFSPGLVRIMVGLLLVANTINLGADLGAMADALRLLIGGPPHLYVVAFALICIWLEVFLSYRRYVAILKWTTLSLLAYVATVLVIEVPWGQVALDTLIPSITWERAYLVGIVAVLGTTISPYLFFWQSSEEAEDERVDPKATRLIDAPEQAKDELRRIRVDTYIGMGYSQLIAFFILVTTASTLHAHGITDIRTSAEAAEALRPIAGPFASVVFALGIIGTGMLAVPVLAGSAAYAIGEARQWPTGLGRKPREAKAFYGTIAAATVVGILINFLPIDPMKGLFWAAVINGVVAVPIMVVMMVMASRPGIMGAFVLSRPLRLMGWLTTAVMTTAVLAMFWTMLF
ncbi:divalent metal cation transporter [Iodidimonas sp. SYSU 1G8]